MTHTAGWARGVELARLDTAVRALELVLEEGCWPTGLPLTDHERATTAAAVEELRAELRARQARPAP